MNALLLDLHKLDAVDDVSNNDPLLLISTSNYRLDLPETSIVPQRQRAINASFILQICSGLTGDPNYEILR